MQTSLAALRSASAETFNPPGTDQEKREFSDPILSTSVPSSMRLGAMPRNLETLLRALVNDRRPGYPGWLVPIAGKRLAALDTLLRIGVRPLLLNTWESARAHSRSWRSLVTD